MKLYKATVTIHDTGTVIVEANSVKDAEDGLRSGRIKWDEWNQSITPKIGIVSVRKFDFNA